MGTQLRLVTPDKTGPRPQPFLQWQESANRAGADLFRGSEGFF